VIIRLFYALPAKDVQKIHITSVPQHHAMVVMFHVFLTSPVDGGLSTSHCGLFSPGERVPIINFLGCRLLWTSW